jgi:hypothetical protein
MCVTLVESQCLCYSSHYVSSQRHHLTHHKKDESHNLSSGNVVHACHPCSSGSRHRIIVQGQIEQALVWSPSSKISWVWSHTLVVPATAEAQVREASLGWRTRPYLRNKLKAKGLGYGSSGRVFTKHEALSKIPSTVPSQNKTKKTLRGHFHTAFMQCIVIIALFISYY